MVAKVIGFGKYCPIDRKQCDAKSDIAERDIGDWVHGKCRHGFYNEEDNTLYPCDYADPREHMIIPSNIKAKYSRGPKKTPIIDLDRKKKSSKTKSKRKVCKCKK